MEETIENQTIICNHEEMKQNFEKIIDEKWKTQCIQRQFRSVFMKFADFKRVIETPGEMAEVIATGSGGLEVVWHLYNSIARKKVFLIWKSQHSYGCRESINEIQFLEDEYSEFL